MSVLEVSGAEAAEGCFRVAVGSRPTLVVDLLKILTARGAEVFSGIVGWHSASASSLSLSAPALGKASMLKFVTHGVDGVKQARPLTPPILAFLPQLSY